LTKTVILQARRGSTRLPAKIFKGIGDKTMLECVVNQISHSKKVGQIIIATTTNKNDLAVVEIARGLDLPYFKGSEHDVLDRFYMCAEQFALKDIVRITSDCPLIDPEIIDDTILLYENNDLDYANNFTEENFPEGFTVEVFTKDALERAWGNTLSEDREHVTRYIYKNHPYFKTGTFLVEEYPNEHLSVDTKEDLERVRDIYKTVKNRPILIKDVLEYYGNE